MHKYLQICGTLNNFPISKYFQTNKSFENLGKIYSAAPSESKMLHTILIKSSTALCESKYSISNAIRESQLATGPLTVQCFQRIFSLSN